MIKTTCDIANKEGKWLGVCGNLASNSLGAKILTGLGVSELSVSSASVANIKAIIRDTSLADCKILANKALQQKSAAGVKALDSGVRS